MPNTKHSTPMKVMRLGECTNLWSELTKSPQCVIGGFTLNISTLRRLSGDSATTSHAMDKFLDRYLYVVDETQNPNGLSVSELYETNANTEVAFDPLRSAELDWKELNNLLLRENDTDEYRTINYEEMLDQIETRIALFANRPLQRRLVVRLAEKQKEYAKGWVHFRQRVRDFWSIAYEVCLDGLSHTPNDQMPATSDILDWVFLSNDSNRTGYQMYLFNRFESRYFLNRTLNDIYQLLKKMDKVMGTDSRGKKRPPRHKDIINDVVMVISERWFNIWRPEYQPLLDTPLARDFRDNMRVIEEKILDEFSPYRFSAIGKQKMSQRAISDTLTELKELVWAAIESWQILVNRPPKSTSTVDREMENLKIKLDEIIASMDHSVVDISETDSDDTAE